MPKIFSKKEILTLPNFLTLLRLLAIPVMAYFAYHIDSRPVTGFILFGVIWLTDLLDGYIARRYNQISNFGKLFDPAVDKLLQLVTSIVLYLVGRMPLWVPIFLFVKDLIIVLGSLILLKGKKVVHAKITGKIATFTWALCFAFMLICPPELVYLSNYIFFVPAVLAVMAFISYAEVYINARNSSKEN